VRRYSVGKVRGACSCADKVNYRYNYIIVNRQFLLVYGTRHSTLVLSLVFWGSSLWVGVVFVLVGGWYIMGVDLRVNEPDPGACLGSVLFIS
jgi:hypothetical protein